MLPDLEIIKVLRKKAGMTQKDLSKMIGLSQSYINKIENLTAEPPYNIGKKIIDILRNSKDEYENVDPKKLMTSIKTIECKKRFKEAVMLMHELNVSQLPVSENGIIVGSLTKKAMPELIKNGVKNIEEQIIEAIMEPPFP